MLRVKYAKDHYGDIADIVFVDKNRHGRRPVAEMTLSDRVLYRALVTLISSSLPEHLTTRPPIEEFRSSPLTVDDVEYISKTDVTSFYDFVDHERLAKELEAQTGEGPAIDALMALLERVMGRRLGLPQVYRPSDVLGDTYIDPVRRRMRRAGFHVSTYSDDFRIASSSLADARRALEMCAREARELGLALNESKTFTFGVDKYRQSLTEFADAEAALFSDDEEPVSLWLDDYTDDESSEIPQSFSGVLAQASVFEDDAIDDSDEVDATTRPDNVHTDAALRAWRLWAESAPDESHHDVRTAAIAESLLGRALPILGASGQLVPLPRLSDILRSEPALTPQVAQYLAALNQAGPAARIQVRAELDRLTAEPSFSPWQQLWLAWAAGNIRPMRDAPPHYDWLIRCTEGADQALSATACAALGRLRHGTSAQLAHTLDQIGPAWRGLVIVGLAMLDRATALTYADERMDRFIIEEVAPDATRSSE